MPNPPAPATRVVLRWVTAAALLAGLFAMHGLPMTQPAAAGAHAMASHPMPHLAGPGEAPDLLPAAVGCATADHCTATLRTADSAGVPTPLREADPIVDPSSVGSVSRTAAQPARPPSDLSALGISRT